MGFSLFIKNILSCICIVCHKLLVYKNEEEIAKLLRNKQGKQRYAEIRALCKNVTHCQKDNYGCGTPAHKISIEKKQGSVYILAEAIRKPSDNEQTDENKKRFPQILTAQFCYDILKLVSDEDYMVMGFDPKKSRPEDMIIINFPVPPVQVRPSIKMEILSSSTTDDDLTHKIVDIIKNNENLKNTKGDGSLTKSSSANEDRTLLQFHVATYYANDILGLTRSQQKNKKPTKSVSERLKNKEGRVRGNLMGKRVDMSGRTVITSDSTIPLNAVGIPATIAMNLTYPEIATKYNISHLSELVRNSRRIYPGANYVIKNIFDKEGNEEKKVFNLRYVNKPLQLNLGDIVERHLVDGDIVLFNRQPSLHKLSMMGHICQINTDKTLLTFRMNVSVTEPYNADFDGDEMNIHAPQSIQSVCELRLIANANRHFINPGNSGIIIKAKQDTPMGAYILSKEQTTLDWKTCMNILMHTTAGIDHKIPKNKLISGRFLCSQIIPPEINIQKKNDKNTFDINIHNGALLDGILSASNISHIIQRTWFQYGSKETLNFVDDLQKLVLQFLLSYGYTVGILDAIIPAKAKESIYKIIESKRKEVLNIITEYENDPYIMTLEAFEINLQSTLQAVQSDVIKIAMNSFNKNGGIITAILSGSSGAEMNAGQISGCVGQIIVEGKRIKKKFNNRSLPMFHQHDDSAFARGFCFSSFMKGLNPMEFFFHVMSGREGIISTAIGTADTGYI